MRRLTSHNLYDVQAIEETLEGLHRKWTALKVTERVKRFLF